MVEEEKCDQHQTAKCGQRCLLPLVPCAIIQILPLSLLHLLLAESLSLVAEGKGNISPPFSKRESSSDETPRGS